MVLLNYLKKSLQNLFLKINTGDAENATVKLGAMDQSSVVLLFSVSKNSDLGLIEKLIPQAQAHFKKVSVFALYSGLLKPPVSAGNIKVLSIKDFTLSGKPIREVMDLFSHQHADLLLSMSKNNTALYKHLVRCMPIPFKAGVYCPDATELFQFMLEISVENELDNKKLEHFIGYLKNIKTHTNE